MGAGYHRGTSTQDVRTPGDFLTAIFEQYGVSFDIDAAANADNAICTVYYSDEKGGVSGLEGAWASWTWCNPPYSNIRPWVEKASRELRFSNVCSMLLVPASVGSNWWAEHVNGLAHVVFLNGRITFEGHTTPYPKDLALLIYSPFARGGYEVWSWNA